MVEILEDYLAPLVRHLRDDPVLQELHNTVPSGAVNPILGPPSVIPDGGGFTSYKGNPSLWIFRGFDNTGEPFANVEGTGSCAITLESGTPWSNKVRGKSLSFVQLQVFYHCDVSRDPVVGGPVAYDARDKCLTLHKRVSRLLHSPPKGPTGFAFLGPKADGSGALKLVDSEEGRGLTIDPIPQGDGMVEGRVIFDLSILL